MTCYHPITAYRLLNKKNENGKSIILFKHEAVGSQPAEEINLPCSQCIGCRIDRSRQWAIRCVHEKSLFEKNCFITLTYNPENLPENGSLVKSHFQKFMKRLRKQHKGNEILKDATGKDTFPIRYFHCGEYGALLQRPHHHACIFNFDFPDRTYWKSVNRVRYYRSQLLEKLWPFGYSSVGDVTVQSAAYVARYITKKISGKKAEAHYTQINKVTGEINRLQPEYITMSRRPGIGKRWFEKYYGDIFPKDFITHQGKKWKTPAYYDKLYDSIEPEKFKEIKEIRVDNMKACHENNTDARLRVREICQKARAKTLEREYENDDQNVQHLRQKKQNLPAAVLRAQSSTRDADVQPDLHATERNLRELSRRLSTLGSRTI